MNKEKKQIIEYNYDKQKLLLRYLISSESAYVRCQNILNPLYWTEKLRPVARFIIAFTTEYRILPTSDVIQAETNVDITIVDDADELSEWFFHEIEEFCRHKAMETLIYDGPALLERGEYAELERRSRDNMMISLQKDLGTDYFSDPLARLQKMKDRTGMTSTGWAGIDAKLYGGFNRGELSFFVGGPGCVTADTTVHVIFLPSVPMNKAPKSFKVNRYHVDARIEHLNTYYSTEEIERICQGSVEKLIWLYGQTQPRHIEIKNLQEVLTGSRYLVESPDGWIKVTDFVQKSERWIYQVTLENGMVVKASEDHLFQNKRLDWISVRDLRNGDILITKYGLNSVQSISKLPKEVVYDITVAHKNERYYTNGVCSHNTGKSLFLQNISLNWVQQGLNVVYITLELSEELVGLRFDAMITQKATTSIFKDLEDAALKLSMAYKQGYNGIKYGKLQIKSLPGAGTTANDIRAYLKEYEVQSGVKVDALVVDYLDLLHTNNSKIDIGDLFIKDKYTSEELRALAKEWNILAVSASQLNRAAVQQQEFDASHIAGGISKINTADNVMAIFTSAAMREEGQYQIQFLKTRSSSGVGSKVMLKFDIVSLRISDSEESDYKQLSVSNKLLQQTQAKKPSNLLGQPKTNGKEPDTAITNENTRNRIRDLASRIKRN